MNELRIYPADLQAIHSGGRVGLCMRGCRVWAARQGIDWAGFVREGVAAETLLATGDPMAEAAVAVAKERENG